MVKGSASARHAQGDPAVLGEGIKIVGRIHGTGDLRVLGQVDGDISVSGSVHIGEDGFVKGKLEAAEVVVAGRVDGDTIARGSVAITATGRVEGNITAAELTLEPGGGLEGRVEAEVDLPEAIA
jgi:cytoskeletal protein CcmA (bactofilin family)